MLIGEKETQFEKAERGEYFMMCGVPGRTGRSKVCSQLLSQL
jgi:hypothetical protein